MTLLTPIRGAVLLAAAAGYVDTLGFFALFGLLTAHVTGNFVLIGSELVHPEHGVMLKLLAFPAFVAAVALSRVIMVVCTARGWATLPVLLWLESLLLLAFMLVGWAASPLPAGDAPGAILAGTLAALAMGIQNAVGRLVLSRLSPTTIMTGNVTQFVIDLTDLALGRAEGETRQRLPRLGWPILSFGIGATAGAAGYPHFGFPAVLPALAAIVLVAWRSDEVDSKAG